MEFKYKTRGDASPQGKQRVYFSCHPDDFELYFEEISDELLQIQDCAIYYLAPTAKAISQDAATIQTTSGNSATAENPEDLYNELSRMQLIVMPVTSKLLYQSNRAMDTELLVAREKHIPVLPLLQESGLEAIFNEKSGGLQYLNKYDTDPTVIPYEEKLKKFLTSVLVGDELAEKVRAAFDAYVFLSYRKKDRRHAQQLMEMIHRNDFARDLAIWYDEFLTPGENFNSAIQAALEKSSLFTMVVTPNLVNEVNYVMTEEYPRAVRSNKPLLAVEMVDTNQEELQRHFTNVPQCVKAEQDGVLRTELLEKLRGLAIRENDTPEHDFFIGLAYLSGIDVEVDRSRAVALIEGAANAEVPEAMQKLADMYSSGEGVSRSYRTSAEWLEKLSLYWDKQYATDPAHYEPYFNSLWNAGDAYADAGLLSDANRLYKNMEAVAGKRAEEQRTIASWRTLSVSYSKLGNIAEKEGNQAGAKAYYQKGLEIARELAQAGGTGGYLRDLTVSCSKLGSIAEKEGNPAEAKAYYQECLEIAEKLAEESGTFVSRRDLSVICNNLGNIAEQEGNPAEARAYYQKGLEIARKLADESGNVVSRRDLSVSLVKLGGIAEQEGNIAEAKAHYQESLEIRQKLFEESGTIESQRDLLVNDIKLGQIAQIEGKPAEAKAYFQKSVEIAKKLAEESGTIEAWRDLSVSYELLGFAAEQEGKTGEAKAHYQECLKIRQTLAEKSDTMEARRNLSLCYINLGDISIKEGNPAEAARQYQQCLEIRRKMAEASKTPQCLDDYAVALYKCWSVERKQPELISAVITIYDLLSKQCPNVPAYQQKLEKMKKLV